MGTIVKSYIKSRNVSGGEAVLASRLFKEGKTPQYVDAYLLSIGSEAVESYIFEQSTGNIRHHMNLISHVIKEELLTSPEKDKAEEKLKELEVKYRLFKETGFPGISERD